MCDNNLHRIIQTHENYYFINSKTGTYSRVHKDPVNGQKLIGYGHALKDTIEERAFFSSIGLDYDKILNGRQSISPNQARSLLLKDLELIIKRALKYFPDLYKLPYGVKLVILDFVFCMKPTSLAQFTRTKQLLGEIVSANNISKKKQFIRSLAAEIKNSKWYNQVTGRGINAFNNLNLVADSLRADRDITSFPQWSYEVNI